jgi:hypothetical protein
MKPSCWGTYSGLLCSLCHVAVDLLCCFTRLPMLLMKTHLSALLQLHCSCTVKLLLQHRTHLCALACTCTCSHTCTCMLTSVHACGNAVHFKMMTMNGGGSPRTSCCTQIALLAEPTFSCFCPYVVPVAQHSSALRMVVSAAAAVWWWWGVALWGCWL